MTDVFKEKWIEYSDENNIYFLKDEYFNYWQKLPWFPVVPASTSGTGIQLFPVPFAHDPETESGEEEAGCTYDHKTETGLSHRRDVLPSGPLRSPQKRTTGNHCHRELQDKNGNRQGRDRNQEIRLQLPQGIITNKKEQKKIHLDN